MCGPCGPRGEEYLDVAIQKQQPQPKAKEEVYKEIALDPRYLNIVIDNMVNWRQQSKAVGLKELDQLKDPAFSVGELPPKDYFKVINHGSVLWYKKEDVAKRASEILQTRPAAEQDVKSGEAQVKLSQDDRIKELCKTVEMLDKSVKTYLGGKPVLDQEVANAAEDKEQVARNVRYQAQDAFISLFPGKVQESIYEAHQRQLDDLYAGIIKLKDGVDSPPPHNLSRVSLAQLRNQFLGDYVIQVQKYREMYAKEHAAGNNNEVIKALDSLISSIQNEMEAIKNVHISDKLAKIDAIDNDIKLLEQVMNKAASETDKKGISIGTPAVKLFEGQLKLEQRKKMVEELRGWIPVISENAIKVLELKGQPIQNHLNELVKNLKLNKDQEKVLADLIKGKIKYDKPTMLGLSSKKRELEDVANEIRPIISTLIAQALMNKNGKAKVEALQVIKNLEKSENNDLRVELFRAPEHHVLLPFHTMFNRIKAPVQEEAMSGSWV